jgi:tRNA(Ile)-lysidine synthase
VTPDAWRRCVRHIELAIASRKLFLDGQKILVAVSGGLDSMLLLHALHELSAQRKWKLVAAHFNHQLRGAAAKRDERLVLERASQLGLKAVAGTADVAAKARAAGVSLEMAGRKARHDFLAKTARRHRIPSIALAHHADDQVELFFLRLLRGTGGRGLAGMRWRNPSPSDPSIELVRPLLDQSKGALLEAGQAAGLRFSEDATNASLDFERNRVRHELLPLLREHYQPRLEERVLSLMDLTGAESEVVRDLAERWLAAKRRTAFSRLPAGTQRSVLYLQLTQIGLAPDFNLIERLRLQSGTPVAAGTGRWVALDSGGCLRAGKTEQAKFDPSQVSLSLARTKGRVEIGGLALAWEIGPARGSNFTREPNVEYFDSDKVGETVCLRHWRPGDRFQRIGMESSRKLQDLFTDLKVPRAQRHQRVVAATARGELFWVEGLRIAEGFKLGPKTVRRLRWRWLRA